MDKELTEIVQIVEKIKNPKNKKVLSSKQISQGHEKLEAFKNNFQELQSTLQEANSCELTDIETAGRALANLYTDLVGILCYTQDIQELVIKTMKQYDSNYHYNKKEL